MIFLIAFLALLAGFRFALGLIGLPGGRNTVVTSHPIWTLLHNSILLYVLWTLAQAI